MCVCVCVCVFIFLNSLSISLHVSLTNPSLPLTRTQVNLIYPFSGLRRANVVATRNIIQFSQDGKVKPLSYISTNSVFRAGVENAKEDADLMEEVGLLSNGYGQTKWVAEMLVQVSVYVYVCVCVCLCVCVLCIFTNPSPQTRIYYHYHHHYHHYYYHSAPPHRDCLPPSSGPATSQAQTLA